MRIRVGKPRRIGQLPGLEQPRADERLRIDVGQAQSAVVVRQHAHQFAGLEFGQGRLLRVDLVAEDPQMPGMQSTIFIALQAQRRQLRRGTNFGHGDDLTIMMERILTDADLQDAAQSPGGGNQPVSASACGQSRRLVSVGRGSARHGQTRGQADSAVGGLFGVSLVPRHGARIIRRCRHRRADEPLVRQYQSRP